MGSLVVPVKSMVEFVRALSGLFVTSKNPAGIPVKEATITAALLHVLQERREITTEDRIKVAELTNNKVQVVTNYIGKLKRRKVIDEDNNLHPIFFKNRIIITNEFRQKN